MDPVRDLQRIDLKRPRLGSLDGEAYRPPPGPPGGAHRARIMSDVRLTPGPAFCTSNSFHPTATSHSIHQQLIPSPSQVLQFDPSTPSAHWPIPSLPTQTYITGGNHIENHGNLSFYHQTSPAAHDPCLTQLYKHAASNAIHTSSAVDNQGICMPGTRAFTLQRLQSLVESMENDDPDVIWMHGPAGSGKSAIMRTMANALDEQGVLLGSFFFFRSDAQRNTSVPFIPTIAFQSFASCPATQPHIRKAVHSHPNTFSQSIRHQLHRLLETPLKLAAGHEPKWTTLSPLVIVIDGLDECADADRQIEIIKAMRQLASTIRSSTNRRVKILVASRPEKPIADEFELHKGSVTIIQLDPSDANIDLFYDTRLDEIRRRKGLPESWPSLKQVEWLKGKTSGQYSFAHISMGFLAGGDPVERLKMIENGIGTHGLEPFEALDALYATIFQQIPPEMAGNALLLVRIWLVHPRFAEKCTARLVERMLSLPSGFSLRLLPYLSSIFHISDYFMSMPQFIPYHASLGDFLGSQTRAGKYSLFLDQRTLSTAIVEGMLRLCIVPLTLPIDEETADAWLEDYDNLLKFTDDLLESEWNDSDNLEDFFPLPSTTVLLDQVSLLLPTMDLYAFGYCKLLLSTLFKYCQDLSALSKRCHDLLARSEDFLEYHLASNPSYFHTVRGLLDQIHLIQQLRFATYEALEARGDSGLGLYGLLVVFASGSLISLYFDIDSEDEERSTPAWRAIVAHIVQACVGQNIPEPERNRGEPLPLCTLALQLATTKKLSSGLVIEPEWYTGHSAGAFALFSAPIEDRFPKLSLCLSQTIAMFLDLPLGNTRIQCRILECMACADHAKLCLTCGSCTLNLQRMQFSVLYAVLDFLCAERLSFSERRDAVIDAQTFARCYHFRNVQKIHDSSPRILDKHMIQLGAIILCKLEVERGADTHVVDELRTMVSSLHERQGVHSLWDNGNYSNSKYKVSTAVTLDDCWVCSGVRLTGETEGLRGRTGRERRADGPV